MVHPVRTIFFGTPEFAVPALEALLANARFGIVGVVTQPDRPAGRKKIITPSPVKVAAEKFGLPILQPEKLKDEAIAQIIALAPELAVVVAYGNLIPKRLLDALPRGFVNIHPSLLPKHRGASPLTATILDGDKETGVCLMVLDEGMDHGPVIACRRVALNGDETTSSLRAILTPIGAEMISKELIEYLDGKITATPQWHDQATFCKQIELEGARIDWNKPITEIDRLIRAMHGVTPAWTTLEGVTLLIHAAKLGPSPFPSDMGTVPVVKPGTIVNIKNYPAAACADGYLVLNEIQLAGGKAMSGQAFLNGHKNFAGKNLV
jgi:methionyl-tRNA formyltransferase